ncbi:cyclin-like protein, partial [Tribonema minus]
ISPSMRSTLFGWVTSAHYELILGPATLHLTFSIIDRYCALEFVNAQELRLLGAASLMMAAKYEETVTHPVRTYLRVCGMVYQRHELLGMEKRVLERLQYRLTVPTTYTFIAYAIREANGTSAQLKRARRYAEIALRDHTTLAHLPSEIASAAVYL